MKEVRLLSLELTNYRNIEHEVFVFNGQNAKIVGENRIGKTNTLEAIYFLLTNYLLDGSSDLQALKPLADTKRVVSVKGTFSVFETTTQQIPPKEIILEKQYAEDWVKTRGATELTLKGHYETYFVNGIKQDTSALYNNLVEEYFGVRNDRKGEIDTIQMLCNPLYLGNLGDSEKWTNLRSFIIKLVGDVTDDDVFAKEPKTAIIKEDLEKALGKTEQVKKLYDNDIKSCESLITNDEAQIELLERTERPKEEDVAIAKKGVEDGTKRIGELMSSLDNNTIVVNLESEVFKLKQEVLNKNTAEYTAYQNANANPNGESEDLVKKANDELNELLETKTNTMFDLSKATSSFNNADSHVKSCAKKREECIDKLKAVREDINNADSHIEKTCPTCGKPLDEDKITEALAKYVADLRSKEQSIVQEGKANTDEMNGYIKQRDEAQAEMDKCNTKIDELIKEINEKRNYISDLKMKLAGNKSNVAPFIESQELQGLRTKIAEKEKELEEAKADESKARGDTYAKIDEEKEKIKSFQKVIGDEDYYQRQMETLKTKRDELSAHQKLLALNEQKKECLNLFNYTKLGLLDNNVSKVFGKIRFQLIKENLNGGFDPVCKPYIYNRNSDTLWKSGSKSEKIATGIAIVEAIKNHANLTSLPYLFDEGGEISRDTFSTKLTTNAQIICVKVEDDISKPIVVTF